MTVLRNFGRNFAGAEKALFDSDGETLVHLVEVFERTPIVVNAGTSRGGAPASTSGDGPFLDVTYDAAPYTNCGEYWLMDNEDLDRIGELGWSYQCLDAVGCEPEEME